MMPGTASNKLLGPTEWHLDRKVPLLLIAALLVNAISGIWYASKLDSRVSNLETIAERADRADIRARETSLLAEQRLTRVEDKLDNVLDIVRGRAMPKP